MPDPRSHSAWYVEQQRQRRARMSYWRGIGEVYLQILGLTLLTLAAHAAFLAQ